MLPDGLVFGLLDASDRINDPWLAAKLRGFTLSWSRYDYRGVVLEDAGVNRLLDRALDKGYRWCLLQSYGHVFAEQWRLEHWGRTSVAAALARLLDDLDFLAVGPITGDDEGGYGLDDQCLLVNLRTYAELDRPAFSAGAPAPVELVAPAPRREEGSGRLEGLLPTTPRCRRVPHLPGCRFVDASLRAGRPVRAFDGDLDRNRLYLAPVSAPNGACFRRRLVDGDVGHGRAGDGQSLTAAQAQFLGDVGEKVRNARRGVFLWNLESYADVREPPEGFRPPVSTLYCVAAGFKPNMLLASLGFNQETRVVFFDYSPAALRVRKLLLEEWDGYDYPGFVRRLFKTLPRADMFYHLWADVTPDTVNWDDVERLWDAETRKWGGAAAFRAHWERYRRLEHEFVECDVLAEPEGVSSRVAPRANSVIWWSNAFFTVYGNWHYTPEQCWRSYERWLEGLAANDPALFLYGADPDNTSVNHVQVGPYLEQLQGHTRDPLVPRKPGKHSIRF